MRSHPSCRRAERHLEDAKSLADLSIIVDAEGMTLPADQVRTGSRERDVPDRAAALLDLLHEASVEEVTKREAHALAIDCGGDLDVSRRTINNWMSDIRDEGALQEVGKAPTGATTLEVR